MLNYKYVPDYVALYPGAEITNEVLAVLKQSDRKMKYMEYDLKCQRPIRNEDGELTVLLPGQEDSFERLLEKGEQFLDVAPSPEEVLEDRHETDELRRALALLSEDERKLILALFYERLTEREYAAIIGLTQKAVNKRRHKILAKLKEIIKI